MNHGDAIAGPGGTVLRLRRTPWDARALGFGTAELLALPEVEDAAARELLAQAEGWCRGQGVRYVIGRAPAAARGWRAALEAAGWACVECSLTLSRTGMGGLPEVPAAMRPTLRPATAADVPALRRIAHEDFAHGRLLEDPLVDVEAARTRTANWIEELAGDGLAWTAEARGRVIGFHAERVDAAAGEAELILTGAAASHAVLALPLWTVALEALAARGIGRCRTLVSAANTGVLNLYARLGFQFHDTLFGYRKLLP